MGKVSACAELRQSLQQFKSGLYDEEAKFRHLVDSYLNSSKT